MLGVRETGRVWSITINVNEETERLELRMKLLVDLKEMDVEMAPAIATALSYTMLKLLREKYVRII